MKKIMIKARIIIAIILVLLLGAAHAYSIFTDPVKYREYVEGFLNRISN